MSFHYSVFGEFSSWVQEYADLRGFVPEPGDSPDEFEYPAGYFESGDVDEAWEEWVDKADAAREKADESLKEWREAYV